MSDWVTRTTIDLATKALLTVEWATRGGPVYVCRGCNHSWTFKREHDAECRVHAALTALGYPDRRSRDEALIKLRDNDFDARWGREKPKRRKKTLSPNDQHARAKKGG